MNRIVKLIVVSLIGFAVVAAAEPAFAAGPKGPTGWQIFCLDHATECVGGGAKQISVTDATMSVLKRVNSSVNRSISPRRDAQLDIWSVNVRAGDCEDYALTKRHKLIQSGIPASALRIAEVRTPRGTGHAILVVDTDRGRFVLDNLTSAIKPLNQTRYRVVSIQTANPKAWM